eukprot:1033544-Pelagomonas_calceolata.AAC.1
MKTEHKPAGWNWSKLYTGHALPNPPNCNPVNGEDAPDTHIHPDSRTYSNPLFDAQDMDVKNAPPSSQDSPSPNSQPHTEAHRCQDRHTCKKNNSHVEGHKHKHMT